MSHPQDLPLREQAALVADGSLDPYELLERTLERIAKRDKDLRAVVATFEDESREMIRGAPPGPLRGVPVAVKDMWSLPWRAPRDGSAHEQLPAGESGVYRRLRAAGAIVVGVTNMHIFGAGSTGHLSAYGAVGNPWELGHCGGGSSGGSAAAVSARLVAGAVGSDGGGSIRFPAAYCGVTGLKGTFDSTPREGFSHGYSSMSAAGPLCRDATDARLLAEALFARTLAPRDGSSLRVGLVREPYWSDVDERVLEACRAALDESGWSIGELTLAGNEHVPAAALLRLLGESLPGVGRKELAGADPLTRALFKQQLLVPARQLMRADRVRALLRRSVAEALRDVDLLAWPTVPAPAPPIAEPRVVLPSGPQPADPANLRHGGLANLTGIPAISVPVGLHPEGGLPVALSLYAPWGEEALLLSAAEHIEGVTGRRHFAALPPLASASA